MAGNGKSAAVSGDVIPHHAAPSRVQANKTRAMANKAINQQALREKIANSKVITKIFKLIQREEVIRKNLAKRKFLTPGEQAKHVQELNVIKSQKDSLFKLLNKFLPDLRSINFEDADGNNPLAVVLTAWSEALDQEPH